MRHVSLLTEIIAAIRKAKDDIVKAIRDETAASKTALAETRALREDITRFREEIAGLADATRAVLTFGRDHQNSVSGGGNGTPPGAVRKVEDILKAAAAAGANVLAPPKEDPKGGRK